MAKYDRQKIYDKYGGHCAYCGCEIEFKAMQVDHVISQLNRESTMKNRHFLEDWIPGFLRHLTYDDLHHIDNLMPSCRSCNLYKSAMRLEVFRRELWLLVERLNKRVVIYKISKRYGTIQETNKPIQFYFEQF